MSRWAVVVTLLLGGCFAPTYPEGLACGAGPASCPPGQTCGQDGTCRAMPVHDDAATTDGPVGAFAAPRPLAELNGSSTDQDPALTPDLRVIYFSSDRPGGVGGTDLYRASRPHAGAQFETPQLVPGLNSVADENHPWISPDERTIYFDSNRDNSFDIWRATWNDMTASWNAPEVVLPVSVATSLENAPDVHENELVFGSDRIDADRDLYRSLRPTTDGPWEGAERLSELSSTDIESGPTQWAKEIYFMRQQGAAQPRIMRAPRMGASFGAPSEVTEVGDASDPWISPDGRTLFLTVIPSGNPDLFVTER